MNVHDEALSSPSDLDLMKEAWLLDRKIARRQGEQIVDALALTLCKFFSDRVKNRF
jgi:hypothetical protein